MIYWKAEKSGWMKRFNKNAIKILFVLFISIFTHPHTPIFAQSLPSGYFLADSIRIGSPVVYSLSYRHSPATVIIFPDTNYNFTPFELVGKRYFPTHTDAKGSLDSVVYTLVSFEIDKVQRLSLPVYIVSEKDSTPVFASPDSVYLREMIIGPVDTLSLKANTTYLPLGRESDYSYLILALVGLVVLAGLFVLFFGKQIRQRFRLYRLQRRHLAFLQSFQRVNGELGQREAALLMEKVVVLWKKYIETLSDKPYSTYTTKEIADHIRDKSLVEALRTIDRTVYGGLPFDQTSGSFGTLQHFAVQQYEKRRKEIIKS